MYSASLPTPEIPDRESLARIKAVLAQCVSQNSTMVINYLACFLDELQPESNPGIFSNWHAVCENRGGHNLASMACEAKVGWSEGGGPLFRRLAANGFDVSFPDAAGRVPALRALGNDRRWMTQADFQWAFQNGLDALSFYPDTHTGQSLLSVDFIDSHPPELVEYLMLHLKDRLLALDAGQRARKMVMLHETALPCYAPLLADLDARVLDHQTISGQALAGMTRRI